MTADVFSRSIAIADDPAYSPRPPKHKPSTSSQRAGKVGRHDPCPCGSGKKLKKCCLWGTGSPGRASGGG